MVNKPFKIINGHVTTRYDLVFRLYLLEHLESVWAYSVESLIAETLLAESPQRAAVQQLVYLDLLHGQGRVVSLPLPHGSMRGGAIER